MEINHLPLSIIHSQQSGVTLTLNFIFFAWWTRSGRRRKKYSLGLGLRTPIISKSCRVRVRVRVYFY